MDLIELKLLDGTKICLTRDWSKVYDIYECTKSTIKFTSKFPFIKKDTISYVRFSLRTHYETMNSNDDPIYRVKCSLVQLAHMFGKNIVSFNEALVNADLQ